MAEVCRSGRDITAHATTNRYIVQIDVGPIKEMYTPAEVDAQHPNQGEVVLRGQSSPPGSSIAPPPGQKGTATSSGYHLEAYICLKAGGAVIQDATPTITLVDDTAHAVTQEVPVAVMQGVGADVGDVHYGNNVTLVMGASYTAIASLNGETATLHFALPSAGTSPTKPSAVTDMHGM